MKKILALILTISISLGFAFAQETLDAKQNETGSQEKYFGFIKDMKVGGFFNFEPAAGDLFEYAYSTMGGGVSLEAGIPLPFFTGVPVVGGLMENFGVSLRGAFDGALMRDTHITSIFTMRYTAGAYTRIPLPGNMFAIVPEINYGLVLNLPKATGENAGYVKDVYVDQIVQLGAGLRFTHPKLLDERLEFEFTPTYSLSPEDGYSVHLIGFRLGVLYKFADSSKRHFVSETKEEEVIPEVSEPEPEPVQLTPELVVQKNDLNERALNLKIAFEELAEDAKENNLKKLEKKYKGYEKQVEKIIEELHSVDSEESLAAVELKLNALEEKIGNLEEVEEEAEIELDMAVTELAAKTGHAALIHHPDGSYTIAIPPLTFEANSTELTKSQDNEKALETLLEVLKTDERVNNMTVSVFGYINPDSKSDFWTESEKELARGRSENIAAYLSKHGCTQRTDAHEGKGYTDNVVFNRRVEFLVHN